MFSLFLLFFFVGCGSDQSNSSLQDERPTEKGITVEVDGKRLPPNDEKAFTDLNETMLSKAFGEMLNEFGAKLSDALELSDEVEAALLNPGLNSMEHSENTSLTVYLFRSFNELESAKTIEIFVDNDLFIRFCRVPSPVINPYAVVHHRSNSSNRVRDYFLTYDAKKGWQNQVVDNVERQVSF